MAIQIWEPIIYTFAQGGLAGVVVGFAVRKLNKAIAAVVGLAFVATNVLWIARMMEIDLTIPQLNALIDNLVALLPYTPSELIEAYGPNLGTLTSLPLIGGLLVGIRIGFKLA
jgi:uncharacterized membrane protein (Fun14 family)